MWETDWKTSMKNDLDTTKEDILKNILAVSVHLIKVSGVTTLVPTDFHCKDRKIKIKSFVFQRRNRFGWNDIGVSKL